MKCKRCALFYDNTCSLRQEPVDPNANSCEKFHNELHTCAACGRAFLRNELVITENGTILCGKCGSASGCGVCASREECKFQTDPSPLPRVIQKVVRQGNAQMVAQVKNPDRIAITCASGCPCWDGENCGKEVGECGAWKPIWD